MQSASTPHTWQEFIWLTLAAILGYLATHLPSLFRRKPTQTENDKARAEIRHLDVESDVHVGGLMIDLMKASAQATLDTERLRTQMQFQRDRADRLETERNELKTKNELQDIELRMRERDVKKLKGLLDVHGIKFSEYDEPKS